MTLVVSRQGEHARTLFHLNYWMLLDDIEPIFGGEGGIRTLETVARLHAFQACAFDHSATSPKGGRERNLEAATTPLQANRYAREDAIISRIALASGSRCGEIHWSLSRRHLNVMAQSVIYWRRGGSPCRSMLLLLRMVGVWLLLLAMVAAVIDATKSLAAGGAWVFTSLGQQWSSLNSDSLAAAKTTVETHVGSFMWNPMITEILNAPTWVVFSILGALLFWLGRKRAPGEVFIN